MAQKISIMLGASNAKTARGPKTTTKRGEPGSGATQHGELPGSEEPKPSEKEKLHDEIQYQKRNATRDWVAGRITTADHKAIHDRANHAMKARPIHAFRGKSGERKNKTGIY